MKNRNKHSISKLAITALATLLLAVAPVVAMAQGGWQSAAREKGETRVGDTSLLRRI